MAGKKSINGGAVRCIQLIPAEGANPQSERRFCTLESYTFNFSRGGQSRRVVDCDDFSAPGFSVFTFTDGVSLNVSASGVLDIDDLAYFQAWLSGDGFEDIAFDSSKSSSDPTLGADWSIVGNFAVTDFSLGTPIDNSQEFSATFVSNGEIYWGGRDATSPADYFVNLPGA